MALGETMKATMILLVSLLLSVAACTRSESGGRGADPDGMNPVARSDAAAGADTAAGDLETVSMPPASSPAASGEGGRQAAVVAGERQARVPVGPAPPRGVEGAAAVAEQTDSAGRILGQAAARYGELGSQQADFTMSYENPLLHSRTTGAGVLYQKRPDRLLLRFTEPEGDVILSDGRWFWIYYPSLDPAQVLRSAASAVASSGVDLQAQFLGDPTRRFAYTLDGRETVGGRAAWLLTLEPRERQGYKQLRVWIDQRDYLARRFEITEDNGSIRRFELRNLRLEPALADGLFRFDVPAGARVITR
jgi:outer membrane lipoprotein-sorting protein